MDTQVTAQSVNTIFLKNWSTDFMPQTPGSFMKSWVSLHTPPDGDGVWKWAFLTSILTSELRLMSLTGYEAQSGSGQGTEGEPKISFLASSWHAACFVLSRYPGSGIWVPARGPTIPVSDSNSPSVLPHSDCPKIHTWTCCPLLQSTQPPHPTPNPISSDCLSLPARGLVSEFQTALLA